jgi:hypothetical protein
MTTTPTTVSAASGIFTIDPLRSGSSTEQTETFFKALADAVALAREGKAADSVRKPDGGYPNKEVMEKKLNLFKKGALMSITLTKCRHTEQQLRGWIVGPNLLFWENGVHVDEYDNRAVFDATGDPAELLELAEKHLTQEMRRFEDDKFVIWI